MAAAEGETFQTEPLTAEDRLQESSLKELREMLVDIQITVNNILLENNDKKKKTVKTQNNLSAL